MRYMDGTLGMSHRLGEEEPDSRAVLILLLLVVASIALMIVLVRPRKKQM